jgi:hypothetical protein
MGRHAQALAEMSEQAYAEHPPISNNENMVNNLC